MDKITTNMYEKMNERSNKIGYYEYPIYVTILSNDNANYKQLATVPSTKMSEEQVAKFVKSLNEARDRVINRED